MQTGGPEAEPTGGIEQHDVLPRVDAAFLSKRGGYLLRPLVKLHTGGCANRYTLEGKHSAQKTPNICMRAKHNHSVASAYEQMCLVPWH